MTMIRLERETAEAGAAILQLLVALGRAVPSLADSLGRGARVTFDTNELALVVRTIESDGYSRALLVLRCDPNERESFGQLAVPVAVEGLYGAIDPKSVN